MRAFPVRAVPEFGTTEHMLDAFDHALLDAVQRDDAQTAEQLSRQVALSPSAIARRLRRLRSEGWIARTIALLSPKLTHGRVRALILAQLAEHADQTRKRALRDRLLAEPQVQLCYEITGSHDLVALLDCANMDELVELAEALFAVDPAVRRYETSFVRREIKFAPFVQLGSGG